MTEDEFFNKHFVPVPYDKKIVEKITQFMEYEGNLTNKQNKMPEQFPKPLPDLNITKLVPSWHVGFLSRSCPSIQDCYGLLNCAIYLEAEPLANLVSIKIAL